MEGLKILYAKFLSVQISATVHAQDTISEGRKLVLKCQLLCLVWFDCWTQVSSFPRAVVITDPLSWKGSFLTSFLLFRVTYLRYPVHLLHTSTLYKPHSSCDLHLWILELVLHSLRSLGAGHRALGSFWWRDKSDALMAVPLGGVVFILIGRLGSPLVQQNIWFENCILWV